MFLCFQMEKAVIIKERCYTVVIRDRVASERSRCDDSINECCSWTVERVIFQGATVAWWLAFHRKKRWASTPRPFWVTFQHSPHDCVDSQVLCWHKRCKTSWKESIKNECVQLNRNWLDCFWRWLRGAGLSLGRSHWRGRYYTSGA